MDKKYRTVLFDLDGTLTDPKEGITGCVAYALASFGITVEDRDTLCKFIGPPLTDSFEEFYGFSGEDAVAETVDELAVLLQADIKENKEEEKEKVMKGTFEIRDKFYLNGEELQLISGSIHYNRVVPEYWRDRLEKLRAMGCNTVETYIAWNEHEPEEGQFCFTGGKDIRRYIELAQELGLYVIVRPTPYVCGEWEFGGFPYWLLNKEGIRLRTSNKVYLDCVDRYYKELFRILTPLQVTHGGPILMLQIENEYGSYGNDKAYLQALADMMHKYSVDVPLFTSDGPEQQMLDNGTLKDVYPTVNFGSQAEERFAFTKNYLQENGYGEKPLMCMEFWAGWFDYWGCEKHNQSDLEQNKKDLDYMMQTGNVNFYMFHGGTNFGFMNGSNYGTCLTPDVTSYDYDAPLAEDGSLTEKYMAFREIISKYKEVPPLTFTTKIGKKAYGSIPVFDKVSLFETLDTISSPVHSPYTMSMEALGQAYGYTLYRTDLNRRKDYRNFRLAGANDRAIIFADEEKVDTLYDTELLQGRELHLKNDHVQFDILMENMGRVNYGVRLEEQKKGIARGVWFDESFQMGWDMYPLSLKEIDKIDFSGDYKEGVPAFYRFVLEVDEKADTYLSLDGFGKGCVFLNGFNLGRYWEIGPQKRLYIPAPLLKEGRNEIVVFETEGKAGTEITFHAEPSLG